MSVSDRPVPVIRPRAGRHGARGFGSASKSSAVHIALPFRPSRALGSSSEYPRTPFTIGSIAMKLTMRSGGWSKYGA